MEKITEEMHLEKQWFEEAREMTIDKLPAFINHIMGDYKHDYGTVCHAVAACAIAAAWAAYNHEQGGITGFQSGFVMWDFVRQWSYHDNKSGLKIMDYDNMLFPQYADKFEKTISADIWAALQAEAKKLLDKEKLAEKSFTHAAVLQHWQSIVDGVVPFGYTVEKKREEPA